MFKELEHFITQIDTGLMGPDIAVCYLVEGQWDKADPEIKSADSGAIQSEYAIIETGNFETTDRILSLLKVRDIALEQIRYVIVTHIHLDHAGGASSLMHALPNAKFVVHSKGARHMIDPAKLIAGATAVYGEQAFNRMYGTIDPIDEDSVIIAEDEDCLTICSRKLLFRDSPGHANHHFCIWDQTSTSWFTGDTFGVGYKALESEQGRFIFPTSSPVQFDPEKLLASIAMMMSYQPTHMYLTHYGKVVVNKTVSAALCQQINDYVELVESLPTEKLNVDYIRERLSQYTLDAAKKHGCELSDATIDKVIAMDIKLNSHGLLIWYQRKQKKAK